MQNISRALNLLCSNQFEACRFRDSLDAGCMLAHMMRVQLPKGNSKEESGQTWKQGVMPVPPAIMEKRLAVRTSPSNVYL